MKRMLTAALFVVATASPALAGDGPHDPEKDKQLVALCGACLTIIPLVVVPLGLAFHLLLRALAPRRTRLLFLHADSGRARTFFLGLVNAFVVTLVGIAAGHLHAPVVWLLATLVFWGLAFFGSHGLAVSLGARITGNASPGLRELALGWFVLVYVGCFPFVGWLAAFYWTCRGTGAALLALLSGSDARA